MKVNGFRLQQAIKEAQEERDLAAKRFDSTLTAFPEEKLPDPIEVAQTFFKFEQRVAELQVAQAHYNLAVTVTVVANGEGCGMTLLEAVKRVGGAGRLEKMWRDASHEKKGRFDYGNNNIRDKDAVVSQRTISFEDAANKRREASKYASALRAAIQMGNATEVVVEVDL